MRLVGVPTADIHVLLRLFGVVGCYIRNRYEVLTLKGFLKDSSFMFPTPSGSVQKTNAARMNASRTHHNNDTSARWPYRCGTIPTSVELFDFDFLQTLAQKNMWFC